MVSQLIIGLAVILTIVSGNNDSCSKTIDYKQELLRWFNEWMDGFEIDYITINELRETYDFIVIGAGIGGSIVAHRLAMDSSHPNVLLIEAGDKHNTSGLSNQMIPSLFGENVNSDIDWKYKTQPSQGYCCKWNIDGKQLINRGKIAGGSAVLNAMMWVRGHREDWDVLFNIDGWKWDDILPYFKRAESVNHYNKHYKDRLQRGYNGAIRINDVRNLLDKNSIFDEKIIKGFVNTKQFKFLENGQNSDNGNNVGVAYTEYNIDDNGHRNNAFIAYNKYLRRIYKKEYEDGLINLDILPNAYVTKILFDKSNDDNKHTLIAKGIEFADLYENKKMYEIKLEDNEKSEIILSGGTINNPQLLMLSGLGPKEELNKHKIKILKDIPGIGNNLQDHVCSLMRYHYKPKYIESMAITTNKIERALNNFTLFKEYLFSGKSVLSSTGLNVNGFMRSNTMNKKHGTKHKYPDLQFLAIAGLPAFEAFFNHKNNVYIDNECGNTEYYKDKGNMMAILSEVVLQHPESRGWIKLKSNDPFISPVIQPNYLKEQFDIDSLIEGHKILSNIMSQPSIKELWNEKMECKRYGDINNDDKALEEYIRDSIINYYHPVGTCKMGNIENDRMAVVDNKLKVRHVNNLRIVDASIFPQQTSGNTQAPTHMVAEKAAHIILEKWNS